MEELVEFKYAPSEQEVLFAQCLVRNGDYAAAWLDAGYEDFGQSKNYTRGLSLSKKSKIIERLEFFKMLLAKKANIKDYEIINEVKAIALGNAQDFFDEQGELVDLSTLSREQMASVKKIKVTHDQFGTTKEIQFHDKLQGLEKLFKMLNLYERNNQASAPKVVLNLGKQEVVNVIEQN